ncbi:MAG: helix-turn-helix transcriptional regulator [Tessaracoccus sp.]|uniref:helix-turn-helix domain-containing protein n=1 Tax=Tessaracoccus sp. TaxID=1971211 RepID=UPI001EB37F4D|nr:helix-turn-helix transcriptional regulator [Tessaracoccus sp.]MBK7820507.1 helix-turn-helix transcriptional regulator [Tessaracoccus sp.]
MTEPSTNAQIELYGATWATRFAALRTAYGLSQGALASIVGLSAPMVSQLVSGHRVKISNPAVLARIVFLEERLGEPEVVAGDRAAIERVLAAVSSSTPELRSTVMSTRETHEAVVGWLSAHASSSVLAELAAHASSLDAVELATALGEAATRQN